jgi:hypothetical protein
MQKMLKVQSYLKQKTDSKDLLDEDTLERLPTLQALFEEDQVS